MRPPQPALFHPGTRHGPREPVVEPSWHVLSPGCRAVCIQTSRRRGRRVVRRVEEFDLSQAVGVGGLTAAAGIAIRSASCQQPRVAALVGAAAAIGLCAVARRRHRPSDLRSSCSSCCQSSLLRMQTWHCVGSDAWDDASSTSGHAALPYPLSPPPLPPSPLDRT